ncbi:hypothetical protein R6Q59_015035 [Mikania micrantha]
MERCILNSNSIERLEISVGESLTHVSFIGQKLKSLYIFEGHKLIMENMMNTSMPMLEKVIISDCTHLKSELIQLISNSIHLISIEIYDCPSIESFPDIQIPNLTSLIVESCKNLKSFPDIQLLNLTNLWLSDCPSIDAASFTHGNWPPNLVSLKVGGLKKPISEWGSQNFPTSLVTLLLCNEPHIRNFSRLSHLLPSSLKKLSIRGFDKLESLSVGLQHLTSLRCLLIWNCPMLKDLPEALLPSLLTLHIYECPILTRRGSHYWPFISHIPGIYVQGYKVQKEKSHIKLKLCL